MTWWRVEQFVSGFSRGRWYAIVEADDPETARVLAGRDNSLWGPIEIDRDDREAEDGDVVECEPPPLPPPDKAEALLALAHATVNAFVTKLCRADDVCASLRAAGIGPEWDELMDLGRGLPRTRVEVWQVQNVSHGCSTCPAETSDPAPENCPLRHYGAVLLVGEPEPPEEGGP
jgi:hypothetical protein